MKVRQTTVKKKITHKETLINKHALLPAFYFASFSYLFTYICAYVCFFLYLFKKKENCTQLGLYL